MDNYPQLPTGQYPWIINPPMPIATQTIIPGQFPPVPIASKTITPPPPDSCPQNVLPIQLQIPQCKLVKLNEF